MGGNFQDYEAEHEIFHQALNELQTQLSKQIKNKTIERQYVPSYLFSDRNLIVVLGQDGLVANTAKYSKGIPIIAVNPDKARYDGLLLPFDIKSCISAVEKVLANRFNAKTMRFAEAKLNDGQRLLAFNDLFIGAATHVSARYKISFQNKTEEHSSSGLIVSTLAGSTGWMSSIFNMAYGITNMFDKNKSKKTKKPDFLQENELFFAVREPFQTLRTQIAINAGIINSQNTLKIESLMPTNGVIFSDGIESDFLRFNSGAVATIGIAKETACMVMKS